MQNKWTLEDQEDFLQFYLEVLRPLRLKWDEQLEEKYKNEEFK